MVLANRVESRTHARLAEARQQPRWVNCVCRAAGARAAAGGAAGVRQSAAAVRDAAVRYRAFAASRRRPTVLLYARRPSQQSGTLTTPAQKNYGD